MKSGTTIAYKNGVIACDKQITDENLRLRGACKAIDTEETVYLITGYIYKGLRFVQWLTEGEEGKAPKLKGTWVVAFDKKTGRVKIYEGQKFPITLEDSIYAAGSGGQIALGAMAAGATPEQAISIAAKYDVYTGLGVQVFYSERHKRYVEKKS